MTKEHESKKLSRTVHHSGSTSLSPLPESAALLNPKNQLPFFHSPTCHSLGRCEGPYIKIAKAIQPHILPLCRPPPCLPSPPSPAPRGSALGLAYVDRLLLWSGKIQDPGSGGELTISDPGTQPCSLRLILRLRLSKLANSLIIKKKHTMLT